MVQIPFFTENFFLAENSVENLRKELTDVRRQLADSNFEKDKYNSTNKDLREHIKRTEGEKRETSRALEEAFQKIACEYGEQITEKCLKQMTSLNFCDYSVGGHENQIGSRKIFITEST